MKSSQTNSNLAQLQDYYINMPVSSPRTNKLGVKSQVTEKESRQYSNHVDGVQRKSIKVKNLLVITDDQKLFHNVQENIQSYTVRQLYKLLQKYLLYNNVLVRNYFLKKAQGFFLKINKKQNKSQ